MMTKNHSYKRYLNTFLLALVLISFVSCKKNDALFGVNSFKVNDGWGYEITINKKIVIKQSVIPSVKYKKSFKSEDDALKVGNFVMKKVKHKESPTVDEKDLIALQIDYK